MPPLDPCTMPPAIWVPHDEVRKGSGEGCYASDSPLTHKNIFGGCAHFPEL